MSNPVNNLPKKQTFEPVDMGCVYLANIEEREFRHIDHNRAAWTQDYEDRTGKPWRMRGSTLYILPPADPKTKFSVLKIYPAIEIAADPRQSPTGDEKDHDHLRREVVISPYQIAQALLHRWADAIPGSPGSRGIAIIGDEVPTADEVRVMNTNLKLYCERKVAQAQDFYTSGNAQFIGPVHQECAKLIGAVYDWVTSKELNKYCPSCGGICKKSAMNCPSCGTDFEKYYLEVEAYSMHQLKSQDPDVHARILEREARRAARAKEGAAPKA